MIQKIKKISHITLIFTLLIPTKLFAATLDGVSPDFGVGVNKGAGGDVSVLGVIGAITQWLLGFVGALSVLIIVIAGIMYMTSGGDEGRIETAKKWLIYAIVGLVVALLGWVIVNTVINAL